MHRGWFVLLSVVFSCILPPLPVSFAETLRAGLSHLRTKKLLLFFKSLSYYCTRWTGAENQFSWERKKKTTTSRLYQAALDMTNCMSSCSRLVKLNPARRQALNSACCTSRAMSTEGQRRFNWFFLYSRALLDLPCLHWECVIAPPRWLLVKKERMNNWSLSRGMILERSFHPALLFKEMVPWR